MSSVNVQENIGFVELIQHLQDKYFVYYPGYAKMTGGMVSAILLQAVIFWNKIADDEDGVPKAEKKILQELQISSAEFKTAKAQLVSNGLIKVVTKGLPRISYYKQNNAAINAAAEKVARNGYSAIEERKKVNAVKYNYSPGLAKMNGSVAFSQEIAETRMVVSSTDFGELEQEAETRMVVSSTDFGELAFHDVVNIPTVISSTVSPDCGEISISNLSLKESLINFESNAHDASPEAHTRNAKTAQDNLWANEAGDITEPVNSEIPATAKEPLTPSSAAPPFPAKPISVTVDASPTSTFTQTHEKSARAALKGSEATKVKAEVVEPPSRAKKKGVSTEEFQAVVDCWNENRPKGDGQCQAFSGLRVLSKRAKGQIERAVKEVGLEGALDALKYGLMSVQSDPYWSKKWQGKSPSFENLCSNEKLVAWYNEFETAREGGIIPAPVAAQIQQHQETRILDEQRQFAAREDAQKAELRRLEELKQADLNAMGVIVEHFMPGMLEGRTPTQREFDHFIKRDDIQKGWQRWLQSPKNPKNRPTL